MRPEQTQASLASECARVTEAELLAKGLGREAVALLLQILRGKGPADVHVLLGPLRSGGRRSVEVIVPHKATGEGQIVLDGVDVTT